MVQSSTQPSDRFVQSNEWLYFVLFVVTLVLVTWQYFGMPTRLDVFPGIGGSMTVEEHSDAVDGGISITRIMQDDESVGFDCQIVRSQTFAFCGINIPLVESGKAGIDLSHFDRMQIEFDIRSEEKDTLLIYLMNDEAARDGTQVWKANLRAVYPTQGANTYQLPVQQFFVPSWWLFKNPNADSNPRLDSVTHVQVTTGDNTTERQTSVRITRLVLHGKLIAADNLYFGLLLAWLSLFLVRLLSRIRHQSERLKESHRVNKELSSLNQFLSIQKDQYESMAKRDDLTGALNRAGAREALEALLRQNYSGQQQEASLLSIDIDHFKQINDRFGHDVGDDVLKQLTTLIDQHTRAKDRFVRWGGEEFVLICPETQIEHAARLAETLRVKIEQHEFIQGQTITCSFGVTELHANQFQESFKRADEALYEAKNAGRNCVRRR